MIKARRAARGPRVTTGWAVSSRHVLYLLIEGKIIRGHQIVEGEPPRRLKAGYSIKMESNGGARSIYSRVLGAMDLSKFVTHV